MSIITILGKPNNVIIFRGTYVDIFSAYYFDNKHTSLSIINVCFLLRLLETETYLLKYGMNDRYIF